MRVEDNNLALLLSKLELSAQYRRGRKAALAWNTSNPIIKRGLAISVYEALPDAIASVGDGRPVRLTAPATAENVLKALAG